MKHIDIDKWDKRRHEIVNEPFGTTHYMIDSFENVGADAIKTLVDEGYVDLNQSHNNGPTVEEIYQLMDKYPEIKASGYMISPDRKDCRLDIDTLQVDNVNNLSDLYRKYMREDLEKIGTNADSVDFDNDTWTLWWD